MAGYRENRLPKIKSYISITNPCYILLQNFSQPDRAHVTTTTIIKKVLLLF